MITGDSMSQEELSFFAPRGYQRNYCGYCKREDGSASYYASSTSCRPEEYEELVNRGWRRSGTLYYKQNPARSCCPHYTMRLEAAAYKPRRDQKKAQNRWTSYVLGREYVRKMAELRPRTREEKKHRKSTFDLKQRVHEAEYSYLDRPIDPKTGKSIEPAHKFEVHLEADSLSKQKYDIFLAYQMQIHKDEAERWKTKDYTRFLCSGLRRKRMMRDSAEKKLGSYHQVYRLDGKIIAVAVLDLLPTSISSVYLYYDPEYEHWELGKLSAMREIVFALDYKYQYYHMGYYIHSCPKMKYKATFRPQQLQDPETLAWIPFVTWADEFAKHRYVSFRERKAEEDQIERVGNENLVLPDEQQMSLFDVHMPGVLTLEELNSQIDLDHWCLVVHSSLVELEDLVGWETSNIKDPYAIKGIAAELAAVLGPEVVSHSAIVLFNSG